MAFLPHDVLPRSIKVGQSVARIFRPTEFRLRMQRACPGLHGVQVFVDINPQLKATTEQDRARLQAWLDRHVADINQGWR